MATRLLAVVLVLVVTATCVRLGFWQIDRWHEKRRLNAEMTAALEAPVLELHGAPGGVEAVRGRRVAIEGRFDERRPIPLSYPTRGRALDAGGAAGPRGSRPAAAPAAAAARRVDARQLCRAVVPVRLDSARWLGGAGLVARSRCVQSAPSPPGHRRRSRPSPARLARLPPKTGAPPMHDRSRSRWFPLVLAALALLAPLPARAASAELAKLCDDYWQGHLRFNPEDATAIGDRRYDDRLEDNSAAGIAKETKWLQAGSRPDS